MSVGNKDKADLSPLIECADHAYHLALRVTRNHELAEEAVQEAFSKLVTRPPQSTELEAQQSYLMKVVRGSAIDLLRQDVQRKRREEAQTMNAQSRPVRPDEAAEEAEIRDAAKAALAELSQEERETVGLCCELSYSLAKAAEILEAPKATVNSRLQRALDKMRQRLTVQGFAGVSAAALPGILVGAESAPEPLRGSIMRTVGKARKSRYAARRSPAASSSPAGTIVTALLLVGAVAGAAVLFFAEPAANTKPRIRKSLDKDVAPAPQPKPAVSLNQTYDLTKGPVSAFTLVNGKWEWKEGMRTFGGVTFLLPDRLPDRPVIIEVLGHIEYSSYARNKVRDMSTLCARTDGRIHPAHVCWNRTSKPGVVLGPHVKPTRVTYRWYFIKEWFFLFQNDELHSIARYVEDVPDQVFFEVVNQILKRIRVRTVAESELPEICRERAKMQFGLEGPTHYPAQALVE